MGDYLYVEALALIASEGITAVSNSSVEIEAEELTASFLEMISLESTVDLYSEVNVDDLTIQAADTIYIYTALDVETLSFVTNASFSFENGLNLTANQVSLEGVDLLSEDTAMIIAGNISLDISNGIELDVSTMFNATDSIILLADGVDADISMTAETLSVDQLIDTEGDLTLNLVSTNDVDLDIPQINASNIIINANAALNLLSNVTGTSLTVDANGDITIASNLTVNVDTLSLNTDGNIVLDVDTELNVNNLLQLSGENVTLDSTLTTGTNVTFDITVGDTLIFDVPLSTGGDIILNLPESFTTTQPINASNLVLTVAGNLNLDNINVNSSVTLSAGGNITLGAIRAVNNVFLTAGGSIMVDQSITSEDDTAIVRLLAGDDITIDAEVSGDDVTFSSTDGTIILGENADVNAQGVLTLGANTDSGLGLNLTNVQLNIGEGLVINSVGQPALDLSNVDFVSGPDVTLTLNLGDLDGNSSSIALEDNLTLGGLVVAAVDGENLNLIVDANNLTLSGTVDVQLNSNADAVNAITLPGLTFLNADVSLSDGSVNQAAIAFTAPFTAIQSDLFIDGLDVSEFTLVLDLSNGVPQANINVVDGSTVDVQFELSALPPTEEGLYLYLVNTEGDIEADFNFYNSGDLIEDGETITVDGRAMIASTNYVNPDTVFARALDATRGSFSLHYNSPPQARDSVCTLTCDDGVCSCCISVDELATDVDTFDDLSISLVSPPSGASVNGDDLCYTSTSKETTNVQFFVQDGEGGQSTTQTVEFEGITFTPGPGPAPATATATATPSPAPSGTRAPGSTATATATATSSRT